MGLLSFSWRAVHFKIVNRHVIVYCSQPEIPAGIRVFIKKINQLFIVQKILDNPIVRDNFYVV